MDDYDSKELEKVWRSFKRFNDGKKVVRIDTFFREAKLHPDWKDEVKLQGDLPEKPKRKRSELLRDLIKSAEEHNLDDYFEDFAEMENRFKRKPSQIK